MQNKMVVARAKEKLRIEVQELKRAAKNMVDNDLFEDVEKVLKKAKDKQIQIQNMDEILKS